MFMQVVLKTSYLRRAGQGRAGLGWAGLMAVPYSAVPSFATKMSLRHVGGTEQSSHLEGLPSRDIVV